MATVVAARLFPSVREARRRGMVGAGCPGGRPGWPYRVGVGREQVRRGRPGSGVGALGRRTGEGGGGGWEEKNPGAGRGGGGAGRRWGGGGGSGWEEDNRGGGPGLGGPCGFCPRASGKVLFSFIIFLFLFCSLSNCFNYCNIFIQREIGL